MHGEPSSEVIFEGDDVPIWSDQYGTRKPDNLEHEMMKKVVERSFGKEAVLEAEMHDYDGLFDAEQLEASIKREYGKCTSIGFCACICV
jgi:hypothetical protein